MPRREIRNTADATPIRSVPCDAGFGQQWKWERLQIKGIGTVGLSADGKCVDVAGNGIFVILFQCNGTGSQQWIFSNGQIINVRSSKCLDVGDGTIPNQQARISSCNPAVVGERFALRSVQLVNYGGVLIGKCLSVMGGNPTIGTPLQSIRARRPLPRRLIGKVLGY